MRQLRAAHEEMDEYGEMDAHEGGPICDLCPAPWRTQCARVIRRSAPAVLSK